jgi:hypothetical protein
MQLHGYWFCRLPVWDIRLGRIQNCWRYNRQFKEYGTGYVPVLYSASKIKYFAGKRMSNNRPYYLVKYLMVSLLCIHSFCMGIARGGAG